jgi:endonuclease/exonuclease/phosphatase (EEP) superfamily protein YafD
MKTISRVAAGALAGWAVARWAGADRPVFLETPTAPLLSFTPHVTAAAPLGVALAARAGDAGAAAAAALAGAALTAAVLPRAVRHRQPEARGPLLRVLTANLLVGRASEEEVVALSRRKAADVLFLQELTDDAVARLKQAGLNDLFPHQVTDARREGPRGAGIYARFPLSDGLILTPSGVAPLTARLDLPHGAAVDLVCTHPHPPTPLTSRWKVARWREELAILPPPADPPRVLAGDFNATFDHAQFRRLLRLGHVDAAERTGRGLIPTWGPTGGPALLTLDHVLVDPRCAVLATSVHRLPGSDHRAVYAAFRLPAGPIPASTPR